MRGLKDRMSRGRNIDTKNIYTAEGMKVYNFMKCITTTDLEDMSIIELRKNYERKEHK